jgi:hypothetical protein
MDIAAFEVSHSVGVDKDATALQAKSGARNIPLGQWMKCRRRFEMQTLTFCDTKITSTRTAAGQFKGQFKGAMDESSGNVRKASTNAGCGVVMDIAAFEVSHSFGIDIDATALRAVRARSRSMVRWMKVEWW